MATLTHTADTPGPSTDRAHGFRAPWGWPLLLAAAAAVAPFWHVWASVYRVVAREDSFGYAALIPLAAGFLAWQRRHRLAELRLRGRAWGLVVAAAGVGLYFLAIAIGSEMLWYIGPLVTLYGAVISALGIGVVVPFAAVFGVLLLVVPPPGEVITWIAFRLMFISATITADLLRVIGQDVEQFRNLIVVNGHEVNVASACSGIRSLFALGAVIGVFAFALPFRWWLRIGMIALAPAMALLGNLIRLVPTAVMHGLYDEQIAGLAHDLLGIVSFAGIVSAYLILLSLLRWAGIPIFGARRKPGPAPVNTDAQRRPWPTLGVVALLGLGTPLIAAGWPRAGDTDAYHARVADAINRASLTMPGMTARDSVLSVGAVNLLRPNASRCVTLTDPATGLSFQVSLIHCRYVRDLMNHYPPVCYPNAGWDEVRATRVNLQADGFAVPATEYHFRRTTRDSIQELVVINLFITPDGRFSATQEDAIGTSLQKGERDAWGFAQISLVFPTLMATESRLLRSTEAVVSIVDVRDEIRINPTDLE